MQAYLERMGKEESDKYVETIRQAAVASIHKYFIDYQSVIIYTKSMRLSRCCA